MRRNKADMKRIKTKMIENKWLMSFIINAIFLLLIFVFCDIKYEVSDDFMIDAALSGAFGNGPDPHLIFPNVMNVVLGYVLSWLYRVMPFFSWYFVFQLSLCFVSLVIVLFLVFDRNFSTLAFVLSLVFLTFFACDLYITMQFTKTAGIACAAGGTLVLYGVWNEERIRKNYVFFGTIIALLGSMLRFQSLYLVLVFLALTTVCEMIDIRGRIRGIHGFVKPLLVCACCVLFLFGCRELNRIYWDNNSEFASFVSYNRTRSRINDVETELTDQYAAEWNKLDMDQTDYGMLRAWGLLDEGIYTSEKMDEIASVRKSYSESLCHSKEYIVEKLKSRNYKKYAIVQGLLGLIGLILFLRPKKITRAIAACIVSGGLLSWLIYRGKIVYRAEFVIIVAAAICILYGFHFREKIIPENKRIKSILIILALIVAFGVSVRKLVPVLYGKDYSAMPLEEYQEKFYHTFYYSWINEPGRYVFDISARKPYNELLKYIKNDGEHYYLIDFSTGIQLLYYQYSPWRKIPDNEFGYYSYIGSVTMKYPDNQSVWQQKGIDISNPFRSLVNDNIYVVDNRYYDTKLAYLQKYYYPDAKMELVDTVDGFQIWKYTSN